MNRSAAALVVALALSGCVVDGPPRTDVAGPSVCATALGEGPRIGLAYDAGGRRDDALAAGAYDAVEAAVGDLDVSCLETEALPGEEPQDRVARLRKLAVEGFDPVFAVGRGWGAAVAAVARSYPDTSFVHVDAAPGEHTRRNVAGMVLEVPPTPSPSLTGQPPVTASPSPAPPSASPSPSGSAASARTERQRRDQAEAAVTAALGAAASGEPLSGEHVVPLAGSGEQ